MYNYDVWTFIKQLLPPSLRQVDLQALCWAAVWPIKEYLAGLPAYAETVKLQAAWNSQIIVFESALNDSFPVAAGGIYIENVSAAIGITFIFQQVEGQPDRYIFDDGEGQPPTYVHSYAELAAQHDFIVHYPASAGIDTNAMQGLIQQLKAAGMRHIIQSY